MRAESLTLKYLLAAVVLFPGMLGCGGKSRSVRDAVEAKTNAAMLAEEVAKLSPDVRRRMRKVIDEAEAEASAGQILMGKDEYAEAAKAFRRSGEAWQKVVAGKETLQKLDAAKEKMARARLLAEVSGLPEKVKDARRAETNADGYAEAGYPDRGIPELEKAYAAIVDAILPNKSVTLEQAVAARTSMPPVAFPASGGSQGEFEAASQAERVKKAAEGALEVREYPLALAFFQAAGSRYGVLAAGNSARAAKSAAESAISPDARSPDFERGKQFLADAEKALATRDLDEAKLRFDDAAEVFRNEADVFRKQIVRQIAAAAKRIDDAIKRGDAKTADAVLGDLERLDPKHPGIDSWRKAIDALEPDNLLTRLGNKELTFNNGLVMKLNVKRRVAVGGQSKVKTESDWPGIMTNVKLENRRITYDYSYKREKGSGEIWESPDGKIMNASWMRPDKKDRGTSQLTESRP